MAAIPVLSRGKASVQLEDRQGKTLIRGVAGIAQVVTELAEKEDAEEVVRFAEWRFAGMARYVQDLVRRNFVFLFLMIVLRPCPVLPVPPHPFTYTPPVLILQVNLPNSKTYAPCALIPRT